MGRAALGREQREQPNEAKRTTLKAERRARQAAWQAKRLAKGCKTLLWYAVERARVVSPGDVIASLARVLGVDATPEHAPAHRGQPRAQWRPDKQGRRRRGCSRARGQ